MAGNIAEEGEAEAIVLNTCVSLWLIEAGLLYSFERERNRPLGSLERTKTKTMSKGTL